MKKALTACLICSILLLPETSEPWAHHYIITRIYLKGHFPQLFKVHITTRSTNERFKHYDPEAPQKIDTDFPCTIKDSRLCPDYRVYLSPKVRVSAGDALSVFSDEPDWGVDDETTGSLTERLMGGAQALRHLYYPFPHLSFPLIVFPQGEAPWRAQHFFNIAKEKFKNCEIYSGIRNLARSFHYAEDVVQPLHTFQTWWKFVVLSSPVKGTEQVTRNFHSGYEKLVLYRLVDEILEKENPVLIHAIETAPTDDYRNVHSFIRIKASASYRLIDKLLKSLWKVLPKRFRKPEKADISYRLGREIINKNKLLLHLTSTALSLLDLSFIIRTSGMLDALETCPER